MLVPIELEIFNHTDESRQARDTGMPYSITDCRPVKTMFLNISAIAPYSHDDGDQYTEVFANGDSFVCNEPYEVVKAKILNRSLISPAKQN